jgi:hypothetical protein
LAVSLVAMKGVDMAGEGAQGTPAERAIDAARAAAEAAAEAQEHAAAAAEAAEEMLPDADRDTERDRSEESSGPAMDEGSVTDTDDGGYG